MARGGAIRFLKLGAGAAGLLGLAGGEEPTGALGEQEGEDDENTGGDELDGEW